LPTGYLPTGYLPIGAAVDFRDQYARAREEQADKLFREIIEIADDASGDYVTTSDGKRIVDHENIQRSRKWAAARLAPKKSDSDPLPKALLVQCSARN
jgi:hypothetical protein